MTASAEKLKVLMIEDVPTDAELIQRELKKAEIDFVARRVETRDALLKELEDFRPDLILSDYSLPLFDGITALFTVKELYPSIPFIIVTGSLSEETAVECIKSGASDYVIKENLVRIGPAVKGALEKKKALEEKIKAEEALRLQTEELARSNKELEQFAYVASHDLQEPLRKIITFGDRLKSHAAERLDATSLDYLHRMQHSALRMRQLVEALLQYALVKTDREFMEKVDLNLVIRDVLSDLEVLVSRSRAQIEAGNLPVVHGDAIQLRQLFQNLISNALKFVKEGQTPRVRISAREPHGNLVDISVEDNGIGFDEKYMDRIFMPFQRLHGQEAYEGIGMGLTICHRIIQRHGGQLSAKSSLGKGSTFIITLPVH